MADFSNESALAAQLQQVVQPKLAEFGWTTGGDDTTLFEYILLMLANDKNESQVAAELSNDLLDLGPENMETQQFARWLFETIDSLRRQPGGDAQNALSTEHQMNDGSNDVSMSALDTDMDGASESAQDTMYVNPALIRPCSSNLTIHSPTGPKAMRNGNGAQGARPARGGRNMLNQVNRQMNRPDDSALHRVRGSGRINSHGREPPKGPRGQNVGRGIEAMANGRGMGNMNMNGMNMPGGMPMPQMGQNGMPGMLNPQQQMALMQMYEQQAQMMQQIFSGGAPTPFVNPNFNHGNRNGNKKPLSQRMDRSQQGKGMHPSAKFTKKEGQDETGRGRCSRKRRRYGRRGFPARAFGDYVQVQPPMHQPRLPLCSSVTGCSPWNRGRHERHLRLRCRVQKQEVCRQAPVPRSAPEVPVGAGVRILAQLPRPGQLPLQAPISTTMPERSGLHYT
jgi:hypothetical protein